MRAASMRGLALCACVSTLSFAVAGAAQVPRPERPASAIEPERQTRLEINDLGLFVWNDGRFAWNLETLDGGLEYPRGSGQLVGFAGGLWIAGRVNGTLAAAHAAFGTDWLAGPAGATWPDTNRYVVYRTTRGDTTGRGAWIERGAALGAPLTSGGEPLATGDQTLWTVFWAGLAATQVESRLTAFAFDRPGALRRAAFLRWRLIHAGGMAIDSAAVGVFFDPKVTAPALRAASDPGRDMGYAYPAEDPASGEAVAVGLVWLGGPGSGAVRIRPTSFVVYANGADPRYPSEFDRVLRGLLPWGEAMVDSSTNEPTVFFSSGDPVAGTGWNALWPPHPHTVLAAQPFTFAQGDTQQIDVAIVVGRGSDPHAAILDLRAAADEARAAWAADFTGLPPLAPFPAAGRLLAYPNPAAATARVAFRVEAPSERVTAIVYDAAGRRVRRLLDARFVPGRHVLEWDGRDEAGAPAGAGLYFVRMTVGGRAHTARIVRLSGD